ncbi:MAG TPA: isoprenylcysteine carboxylmethyltransferase family protein [Bacteroidetes bacterium]|nr:isoprenylcysteine carboxylmethyltransferase family protein [Bacteroidota bacterium]HRR08131.1 isoprenylcysteine carboxylmethyltransferase family protein [Rhodothermales bacterium]
MKTVLYYSLFAYLILVFGLTFFLPTWRVWKKTGIFPITFGKSDNAHDFVGNIFKALLILLLFMGALYAFLPSAAEYLLPVWYIQKPIIQVLGLFLLFAALVWIIVAQQQMASSWRIGIDEKNVTNLVTTGVFTHSRNPIFLGMLFTLLGLFLVLPNALSFAILCMGFVTIHVQVRLEEAWLRNTHGEAYDEYCRKTRRWI